MGEPPGFISHGVGFKTLSEMLKMRYFDLFGEIYDAGNNCRSKEEREAPYAVDGRHQKCN